jgi:hypothetical protein
LIAGDSNGVVLTGTNFNGDVNNAGTITASISSGIRVDLGTTVDGSIENSGSIDASGQDGIGIDGVVTGSVTNTEDGTITGARNGIRISGTVTGGITNSGTIIATTGAGIDVSGAAGAHTINQTAGLLRGRKAAVVMAPANCFRRRGRVKLGGLGSAHWRLRGRTIISQRRAHEIFGDFAALGGGKRGGLLAHDAAVHCRKNGVGRHHLEPDLLRCLGHTAIVAACAVGFEQRLAGVLLDVNRRTTARLQFVGRFDHLARAGWFGGRGGPLR